MPNITFDLGGSGVKADNFLDDLLRNKEEKNKVKVPLPQVGEVKLDIPPFFAQQDAKGKWRLVNPLTLVRNLATRKGKKSIAITRENVEDPKVEANGGTPAPPLSAFSQRDQNRIIRYFKGVKSGSAGDYQYKNKQRGFPATLYKNARKAGLTEDPNTKTYAKNKKKGKAPYIPKPPRPPRRGRQVVLEEDYLTRMLRPPSPPPRVETPPPSPPPSPRRAETPPPEPEPESPKGTKDDEWWDARIEYIKKKAERMIGFSKANYRTNQKQHKKELTDLYKDYFGSLRGDDKKVAEKKAKPVLDELFKQLDYYSSREYEEEQDKRRQDRSAKKDELNELYEDLAERAKSAMSAEAERKFIKDYDRARKLREELDLSDYEKSLHKSNRNKAVVKYNQLKQASGKGLFGEGAEYSSSDSEGENEPHDPDGGGLFWGSLPKSVNERSLGIQPSQAHALYSDLNLNERSMGLGVRPETDGMEAGSLFSMVKDFVAPAKKKAPLEQTISNKELQDLLAKSYEGGLSDYGDYKVDRELSNPISQVYYHEKKRQPIVVHRGSAEGQDWAENARYGLFNDTSGEHFKKAEETQRRAEQKYGTENLTTIGHSKGATHAEEYGKRGKQIITLNKPVSPYDLVSKVVPENQIDIKTSNDPVSFLRGLQSGNKARVLESKTYNPLAEHSTSVLEGTGFHRKLFGHMSGTGNRHPRPNPRRVYVEAHAEYIPPQIAQIIQQTPHEQRQLDAYNYLNAIGRNAIQRQIAEEEEELREEEEELRQRAIRRRNQERMNDIRRNQIPQPISSYYEDPSDSDSDEYEGLDFENEARGLADTIDFEDIKWGSFTEQFKRFKQQHPSSNIKDLLGFANMILHSPSSYAKRTVKRARFYKNVLHR